VLSRHKEALAGHKEPSAPHKELLADDKEPSPIENQKSKIENPLSLSSPLCVNERLETFGFSGDPRGELGHLRMQAQAIQVSVIPLQLLFRENRVDLGMARPADSHGPLDRRPVELAFVTFVCVPRAGDEMMPRQGFFASANSAVTCHE
jgi:hypothetical protein